MVLTGGRRGEDTYAITFDVPTRNHSGGCHSKLSGRGNRDLSRSRAAASVRGHDRHHEATIPVESPRIIVQPRGPYGVGDKGRRPNAGSIRRYDFLVIRLDHGRGPRGVYYAQRPPEDAVFDRFFVLADVHHKIRRMAQVTLAMAWKDVGAIAAAQGGHDHNESCGQSTVHRQITLHPKSSGVAP